MRAAEYLQQNLLAMQLHEISFRDLMTLETPVEDIYTYNGGEFFVVISEDSTVDKETVRDLLNQGIKTIFVGQDDYIALGAKLKNDLLRVTRGLSVGNAQENGNKQISLLSKNLIELYKDPLNDENLKIQYQCVTNLSKFLIQHRGFLPDFFGKLTKQNFHFVITQPMLSSLLLAGFLQQYRLFHEKDIETLFITSYLKDMGMAFVPEDKLEKKGLDNFDRKVIGKHAENSLSILEGRVPFSRNHLNIIRNHHFLNDKIKAAYRGVEYSGNSKILNGFETTIVAIMDMLVAMTNNRPYRKGQSLFDTLDLIKKVMADDYPLEYKALVNYLRHFFTKLK